VEELCVPEDPIFKSFLQAGFECSTHKTKAGKRLDLVASTEHDRLVTQDYQRLLEMGMATAREGTRWHVIEAKACVHDFSTVAPFLEAAETLGIEIIWDLLHFGWPDHLDIFQPEWVTAFERYARAFARFLREQGIQKPFIAPVNEISFVAWAGGDASFINPFETNRGPELKRQLVRGYVAAAKAVREELPPARLVSPEPVIHIVGDPARPDDVRQAAEYRSAMFEAWDMIMGRVQPELGGDPSLVDVIGVNYYDRNQWWNFGKTIFRGELEYRPFHEILEEVYARYRRPMFIAETGTEDEERPDWFAYICDQVRAAAQAGVDLHGICLYPILNHPGWEDDRHCYNGLWDYPLADGSREIYEPLAGEIRRQQQIEWKSHKERNSHATHESGPDLSLAPPMGFCFSTATTPDEPVCS
jgi:beta-glucosidase/6-phospho-beta-glucosidase/beta-galactosidase